MKIVHSSGKQVISDSADSRNLEDSRDRLPSDRLSAIALKIGLEQRELQQIAARTAITHRTEKKTRSCTAHVHNERLRCRQSILSAAIRSPLPVCRESALWNDAIRDSAGSFPATQDSRNREIHRVGFRRARRVQLPPLPPPPLLPFPRSEGVYRWIIKSRILDTCFFSQWRRNVNSALWKRRSALITVTSTARRAWRTSRSRSCSLRFCQGADVNIDRPNCAITQQLGPEEHSFANRGRLVNSARPDPAKVSRRVRLTRPTESHDRNFRWFYVAH